MKLRISHTVWPNGHLCRWHKVDVSKLFYTSIFGNRIFAWYNLGKERNKTK